MQKTIIVLAINPKTGDVVRVKKAAEARDEVAAGNRLISLTT